MGQAPPATDRPSDPGPEPVGPEYVPEPAPPTRETPPEVWEPPPDFDPYTQPIPGFEGDLNWLRRTQLGLAETWAELFRLSRERPKPDRHDPRVVAGLARLKEAWDVYGETFEERTATGPYGEEQAAIWRSVLERLLTL